MQLRLLPTQLKPQHQKEGEFCIKQSQINQEFHKKETFKNKLNFQYSLTKINREKIYGNLIPLSAKMCPSIFSEGSKFMNNQYSSARARQRANRYLMSRYQEIPEHKQEIRRYSVILSKKKKQMQGGIDSFWAFKKDIIAKEEKKTTKKLKKEIIEGSFVQQPQQQTQGNKTMQTYLKLLSWAKQPLQINGSSVTRISIKTYLSQIFGENFATRFLNFYQIKSSINYKEYEALAHEFAQISIREAHLITFFLYDENSDCFICPKDIFSVFQRQSTSTSKVDKDIIKIVDFIKKHADTDIPETQNQIYKIQNVVIRDDWLTIKDYQMFFKKLDEPYLKATNKKDTVFSKSFAVIDHRQKIRSTRKEMTEKKNMYNQLFGVITRLRKNSAYIQSDDYKLNYALLYSIFKQEKSELFKYFTYYMFGV